MNFNIVFIVVCALFLTYRIVLKSNNTLVFRELVLFLYLVNYLISPLIIYNDGNDRGYYAMKLSETEYFNLAIPGFVCFAIGLYVIRTNCFSISSLKVRSSIGVLSKNILIKMCLIGLALKFLNFFVSGNLAFVIYQLGLIRFVGAFGLYLLDNKKFVFWSVLMLLVELSIAFFIGAYHDGILWLMFFGIFHFFVVKPRFLFKFAGFVFIFLFVFFIQSIKFNYRANVWEGDTEAGISAVMDVSKRSLNEGNVTSEDNLLSSVNRLNQGWILASTIDYMNRTKEFQGTNLLEMYLEAAILPRFLAPNKITSGNRDIFNKFSGHTINEGTAMGLGVFADGYIAYSSMGLYLFGFFLGLLFGVIFKIVEKWMRLSSVYVLFLFIILNYAVRPDCELQTTINQLVKGTLICAFLVQITKHRFTIESNLSR